MAVVQIARSSENRHVIDGEIACCGITRLPQEEIEKMLQDGELGESEEDFRHAIHALRSDLIPESKQCSGGCFRIYRQLQISA